MKTGGIHLGRNRKPRMKNFVKSSNKKNVSNPKQCYCCVICGFPFLNQQDSKFRPNLTHSIIVGLKKTIPMLQNLNQMGIYRLPGTKYWVINPNEFQEWFNNWIGAQ